MNQVCNLQEVGNSFEPGTNRKSVSSTSLLHPAKVQVSKKWVYWFAIQGESLYKWPYYCENSTQETGKIVCGLLLSICALFVQMHAHILTEFCSLLISRGHTVCQSYPSCSLSSTPLICLPLRLSLCCCPSLSQTFDTPVAAITIANARSVRSNLSYRFEQGRREGKTLWKVVAFANILDMWHFI